MEFGNTVWLFESHRTCHRRAWRNKFGLHVGRCAKAVQVEPSKSRGKILDLGTATHRAHERKQIPIIHLPTDQKMSEDKKKLRAVLVQFVRSREDCMQLHSFPLGIIGRGRLRERRYLRKLPSPERCFFFIFFTFFMCGSWSFRRSFELPMLCPHGQVAKRPARALCESRAFSGGRLQPFISPA